MSELSRVPEPVPPEDWECCGSNCGDACVWEIYYRDKAAYDVQHSALVSLASPPSGADHSGADNHAGTPAAPAD